MGRIERAGGGGEGKCFLVYNFLLLGFCLMELAPRQRHKSAFSFSSSFPNQKQRENHERTGLIIDEVMFGELKDENY